MGLGNREQRIEMGVEVGETLREKAFLRAVESMKKTEMDVIIQNPPGSLTSQLACAKLQVLNGFLNELLVIYNDGKVAEQEKK